MKKIIIILAILVIIGIVTTVGINFYVKRYVESKIKEKYSDIGKADAILILGCEVRADGTLSFMLKDRLDKGIEAYRSGIATQIIVSGDNREESNTEANAMKQYMIDNGIPEDVIIMDNAGFSTYESMYRLKYTFNIKKCIVITQEYHLYRAVYIGNKLGVDTYGIASEGDDYAGQAWRDIREFFARNKDFIKCIIKPQSTYLEKELPKK